MSEKIKVAVDNHEAIEILKDQLEGVEEARVKISQVVSHFDTHRATDQALDFLVAAHKLDKAAEKLEKKCEDTLKVLKAEQI